MLTLGYVRVSTTSQVEDGHSLRAQRHAISQWAQQNGTQVDRWYADEGVSSRRARPALSRAVYQARRGDAIVVARLDRMVRSVMELCHHLETAQQAGWRLVILDQPSLDVTTPAGRMTVQVLASVAEYERQLIAARTREGLREAARQGRRPMVSDEAWAAAQRMREEGCGYRRIAQGLEEQGYRTPSGATEWPLSTVRRLVHRPM